MKIPKLLIRQAPKKKLRASTARRSMAAVEEMDYEEMSEPNMKLSRALLIVLVLHVVAVAGIIAFNTIKSRQGAFPPPPASTSTTVAKSEPAASVAPKVEPAASAAVTSSSVAPQKASAALVKAPSAKDETIKAALPASAADAGKFYVVAKGDNPVSIAKKLKVSESDLLAVNHIDDPRKLQIGQKLIVPSSKSAKGKKSD